MPSASESSTPAASMTPRVFCKGCGYALVGLSSNKCPECGRGFDLGNRRTFARRPPRGPLWRWAWRLMGVMLLLVLGVGMGIGWLWWGWHCEQKTIGQLRATNAETKSMQIGPEWLGRALGQRFAYLRNRVDGLGWVKKNGEEIERADLKSLEHLDTLILWDCKITNRTLARVGEASSVRTLRLVNIDIDNPNLAPLTTLPRLAKLNLSYSNVSGKWLAQISAMKNLRELNLAYTTVQDDDLRYLQGLTGLEALNLSVTRISDAGLKRLTGLKSLRLLAVEDTLVTPEGLAKLKRAIPGLTLRTPIKAGP